ncbi:hypothetical protein [Haloarchaeobius sp. TZWSO28]|uniref:hypothetical protein n=1 Tax=Haloarchaeobius sp. TZWSO28 TaxID=3446119 RepID=UPI003EC03E36
MTGDTSSTFDGWGDRLTYILGNAQALVAGVLFSVGVLLWLWRPALPSLPPWTGGIVATVFLLGPPLTGLFVSIIKIFWRLTHEEVYHINAATDTRRKYYVKPEVWEDKTVDGPAPYQVNDNSAWEVREFEYHDDTGELVVTGCYMSQMQDSALVTFKSLVYDLHEKFVFAWLERNELRGTETRRALENQQEIINRNSEATERGLMLAPDTVRDSWNDTIDRVHGSDDRLEVDEIGSYADSYDPVNRPGAEVYGPERPPSTDGGDDL